VIATSGFLTAFSAPNSFGWGSVPDPTGGVYSAPSDLLAGLRGPISNGRGAEGEEEEREEGERKGTGSADSCIRPSVGFLLSRWDFRACVTDVVVLQEVW